MKTHSLTVTMGVMALLLSIPSLFIGAESWIPASVSGQHIILPDTPGGRCAADFFRAFNSGNDEDIRAFIQKYRSPSHLRDNPLEEQLKFFRSIRESIGELTPLSCVSVSEYEIVVIVRTALRTGGMATTRFKVDNADPYWLTALTLTPGKVEMGAVDEPFIESTLDALARTLERAYVIPKMGKEMAVMLRCSKSSGRYSGITEGSLLAARITADLRVLSKDQHLSVQYGKRPKDDESPRGKPGPETHYGFREVMVMDNNIGYIRLDEFSDGAAAKEEAVKAMAAVANCAALIFDLRFNSGGSPELGVFLSSYLFDAPTLLGSYYNRVDDNTEDVFTLKNVPGKPFGANKPIYILTSSNTFSAAENFAFCLQDLGRAVIVGEKTKGGGHAVTFMAVNDQFWIKMPIILAISPVTKRNWEGIGVVPDIRVSEDQALDVAWKEAVKKKERFSRI